MSARIGPVSVLPSEGDPRMAGVSEELLNDVDEEVRRVIDECYTEARKLLLDHRERLDALATELLANETLDEADAYRAAGLEPPLRDDLGSTGSPDPSASVGAPSASGDA